jgi:hypothetical protein
VSLYLIILLCCNIYVAKLITKKQSAGVACVAKFRYLLSWKKENGEWRKLHNKGLHDFYSSPSIIRIIKSRRMRWVGHVARMGEKRNAYRLLVGKPEGKRPLGRPRRRWVDNIRMDLG